MVFNSIQFLIFFPIVVAIYFLLPARWRWRWLLAASLYFYNAPVFLAQVLAATLVSYLLAIKLESLPDKKSKGPFLTAGVLLLVANLLVFKYSSFFNESVRSALAAFGVNYTVPKLHILLPIGISFYTFQLISYLVDVSRGLKAERHLGVFTLYVMLFPKVIAGPIERAKNLLPQLHAVHQFDYARAVAGLQLMAWGAFNKVVVADRIAPFVDRVYDDPRSYNGVVTVFATWLYAFQIYCDFNGYTCMALGAAMIMGFKLMQNFNRPYFATSIQDFWKRWHISLSSWLTDYVYTPLTRTKKIKMKWYNLMLLSLFLTFVVSGFWHGAQWTFVIWGMLHGAFVVGGLMLQKPWNKFARSSGLQDRPRLYRALKIAVTFSCVCFAYIPFRATSVPDAFYIATHLFTGWGQPVQSLMQFVYGNLAEIVFALAGIGVVIAVEALKGRLDLGQVMAARPALRWGAYYAGAVSIILLGAYYGADRQFLYFRF